MHVVIIVGGDKMATRPIYISTGNINNPFMEDNINFNSIQELSNESGITINNLSRYIKNNKIDYKF